MASIGGLDPLADAYNLMGMQGMMGPNPYLQYTGKIPMAGFYTGQDGNQPPTDASGKPIQSFLDAQAAHDAWDKANPAPPPGTTLNTPPPVHGVGGLQPGQWDDKSGLPAGNPMQINHATDPSGMPWGQTSLGRGVTGYTWQPTPASGQGGPQQAPAAPPTNPIDMRQAYLDALANPGKVNTPGAQMLPGTTPTGPIGAATQPSVLQAFLGQHAGGGAPGGYSNKGFFNTLNQLKGAT